MQPPSPPSLTAAASATPRCTACHLRLQADAGVIALKTIAAFTFLGYGVVGGKHLYPKLDGLLSQVPLHYRYIYRYITVTFTVTLLSQVPFVRQLVESAVLVALQLGSPASSGRSAGS